MLLRQHSTSRGGSYKGERLQPEVSGRLFQDLRRQLEDERVRDRLRERVGDGAGQVVRLQLQVKPETFLVHNHQLACAVYLGIIDYFSLGGCKITSAPPVGFACECKYQVESSKVEAICGYCGYHDAGLLDVRGPAEEMHRRRRLSGALHGQDLLQVEKRFCKTYLNTKHSSLPKQNTCAGEEAATVEDTGARANMVFCEAIFGIQLEYIGLA